MSPSLQSALHVEQLKWILKVKMSVAQSCFTLWNPMLCSQPYSSVHEIRQAIILDWVASPFYRGSSWPRAWTLVCYVFYIAGGFFTVWATRRLCYMICRFDSVQNKRSQLLVPCMLTDSSSQHPCNHQGEQNKRSWWLRLQSYMASNKIYTEETICALHFKCFLWRDTLSF